jgi:hypothetical protein
MEYLIGVYDIGDYGDKRRKYGSAKIIPTEYYPPFHPNSVHCAVRKEDINALFGREAQLTCKNLLREIGMTLSEVAKECLFLSSRRS